MPERYIPHGPSCGCDICSGQRIQNQERLSSTDRLAWLERKFIEVSTMIENLRKGTNTMGVALWCQTGDHSFDGNDKRAKRVTTDEYDEDGKLTGEEITVHICSRHAADMFKPKPRSLKEIQQELAEATEIGE